MPAETTIRRRAAAELTAVAIALVATVVALRAGTPSEPVVRVASGSDNAATLVGIAVIWACCLTFALVGATLGGRTPKQSLATVRTGGHWRIGMSRRGWFVTGFLVLTALTLWRLLSGIGTVESGSPGARTPSDDPGLSGGEPGSPGHIMVIVFAVVAGALAVAALLSTRLRRTPGPDSPGAEPAVDDGPEQARIVAAASAGLALIDDPDLDPRAAIIACYRTMESVLAGAAGMTLAASDTPAEVLTRAVERSLVPATAAAELVWLFGEARYSDHLMTAGHVARASAALRAVVDSRDREVVTR